MTRAALFFLLALGPIACGGSDGGTDLSGTDLGLNDIASDTRADAVDEVVPPDQAEATDVQPDTAPDALADVPDALADVPDDLATDTPVDQQPDDAAEVAPETTIELPFSDVLIDQLCADTCQLRAQCHGETDLVACAADCVQAIVADPSWAKNLACWRTSGSCEAEAPCLDDPLPDDARCTAACPKAATCGLYPSEMLGQSEAECDVQCTGFAALVTGTEMDAVLDCIAAAIDACDELAAAACLPEQSNGSCAEMCGSLEACQNVPGLFEDHEACLAACEGYGVGPGLAAMACVSIGADGEPPPPPEACAAQAQCLPPPTEISAGTDSFCAAMLELCAGQPDFKIPNDLTVCGWLLTGFVVRFPGADFTAGTACVEAKSDCADPNAVLGCLLPTYAPCTGYCQAIDACIPDPKPAEWPGVEGCIQWCSMTHAQDPTGVEQSVQCVALSGDCGTTMACVPHGQ